MKTRNKPKERKPWIRIVLIWAIESFALVLMSFILDGLQIDSVGTAIVAAAVIGLC